MLKLQFQIQIVKEMWHYIYQVHIQQAIPVVMKMNI